MTSLLHGAGHLPAAHAPDPYAEAMKVQRRIDPALMRLLRDEFALDAHNPEPVYGGEEAAVWKVTAHDRAWVVRIAPAWRNEADLDLVNAIVDHVAGQVPEVPAPRRARQGGWVITSEGNPVTVQPFVSGLPFDDGDPAQRDAAARLLARLHAALSTWHGPAPGTATSRHRLSPEVTVEEPPALSDPGFDRWLEQLPDLNLERGLVHGDYYSRNLLWDGATIAAVVDWDELAVDYREQELAWSIWEFCQVTDGTDLDRDMAVAFLLAYEDAGGTVAAGFQSRAANFIRRRLRAECRSALVDRAQGRPFDREYYEAEIQAFGNLRGILLE